MDAPENESIPASGGVFSRLRGARVLLMILGPLLVLLVGAYLYIKGGRYESTDNAYVVAARVAVSANVAGRVVEVARGEAAAGRWGG